MSNYPWRKHCGLVGTVQEGPPPTSAMGPEWGPRSPAAQVSTAHVFITPREAGAMGSLLSCLPRPTLQKPVALAQS